MGAFTRCFGGKNATTKKATPPSSFKIRYHMHMDESYDCLTGMRTLLPYSDDYIVRALRSVGTSGFALERGLERLEREISTTRALLLRIIVRNMAEEDAKKAGYDIDLVNNVMPEAFWKALKGGPLLYQKAVVDVHVERATKGELAWVQEKRLEIGYGIAAEAILLTGILPDLRRHLAYLRPRVQPPAGGVSYRVPLSVEMEAARLNRAVEARAEGLRMLRGRMLRECLPKLWQKITGTQQKPKTKRTFLDKVCRKLTKACAGKRKAKPEVQTKKRTNREPASRPTKDTTLQRKVSNGSGPHTEAVLIEVHGAEAKPGVNWTLLYRRWM